MTVAVTESEVREQMEELLQSGLETQWRQRAYSSETINEVVGKLRELDRGDLRSRLRLAGFTPAPYRPAEEAGLEQSCSTCMYFERNRQYCVLPEIELPVKPEWSCVLWRI